MSLGIESMLVGVFFFMGTYLVLSSRMQLVTIGYLALSSGANLLVLISSSVPPSTESADIVKSDPLAQAFVLTALVIGLGYAAFLAAFSLQHDEKDESNVPTVKKREL